MPRAPRVKARKTPSQERSRAMVDLLLQTTARVLTREGYDGTSTNKVALAAGVSVGSLYQYFPSKEALVAGLIDRHHAEMMAMFMSSVAAVVDAPVPVAARQLVQSVIEAHAVDPKLHRILTEQVPRVGKLAQLMEDLDTHAEGAVRAYLERHKDELRVKDLALATFVVVHAVETVTHRGVLLPRVEGPEAREHLVNEVVDLIVRYLAP